MTRPGTRLRAIAARMFDAQTMERYVDPAVADLQTEYAEAVTWRERTSICIAGYFAVLQAISIQGGLRTVDTLRELTDDDRRALIRTGLASMAAMILFTLPLIFPFMRQFWSHPRFLDVAVFLIPQALPLSIPVGMTFGILWALGRLSASRTALGLVLVLALGSSLISFVTLAWVMPSANQAFRSAAAGFPVAKGRNELTLGELRERVRNPTVPASRAAAHLELTYYQRWALAATPIALAIFAMIIATARKLGRTMAVVIGFMLIAGFYGLMAAAGDLGLDRTISPLAAAWLPNAVVLMLSTGVASLRRSH